MHEKRYYWLKLKEGFFKDKPMKKLRKVAGGDTYTIIYLKMLLLSLQDKGNIYFDGIEEEFAEEIALDIDEDADNVRFTMMFLEKCGLLTYKDERTIYLSSIDGMIGSESYSAERVRRCRTKKALQCNTDVTECNKNVAIDIEKEKDIDIDIDIDKEKEKEKDQVQLFEEFWNNYPKKVHRALAEQQYISSLIDGVKEEWLVDAAKEYALCTQGTEQRYIKNPENWLKENLYLDYPPGTYEQKQIEKNEQEKSKNESEDEYLKKKWHIEHLYKH